MKILVIIPAYNESASIGRIIGEVDAAHPSFDILVVNDASTDQSGEIARESGLAEVIDLPFNLGIGGGCADRFQVCPGQWV